MVSTFIVGAICLAVAFVISQLAFWSIRCSRRLAGDYTEQWVIHRRMQELQQAEARRREREQRNQNAVVVDRQSRKVNKKKVKDEKIEQKTVVEPPKATNPEEYFDVTRE